MAEGCALWRNRGTCGRGICIVEGKRGKLWLRDMHEEEWVNCGCVMSVERQIFCIHHKR